MIPYDMESMKAIRASNPEVRTFAALEYGARNREWAEAAASANARPVRRRLWTAALAYFSLR